LIIKSEKKQFKCGDILELEVDKLTYQGWGLARADGFAVFIKNACPKDILKARIVKLNKSYAHAEIVEIIKPSEHRVKPFCPIFNACGSCHWQFVDYAFGLEQKRQIIQEAFGHDYNVLPVLPSPQTKNYRLKVQCPARETKVSKRLLVGYFKEKSHDITDIKYCPIQPESLNDIVDYIRKNWSFGAYNEKTKKGLLKHIVLRQSSNNKGRSGETLLTVVLNARELKKKQYEEVTEFLKGVQNTAGCSINYNPENTNVVFADKFEHTCGREFIFEKMKSFSGREFTYKISPQSFFQVNPYGASVLFDEVKKRVKPGANILDAYGGVGAIGIWVSDVAKNIVLVEENEEAVKNAKENFKLNGCKSYEVFLADAKEKFKQFAREKRSFDHVILDPPRKGCDKEVLEVISKITDSIIYVSCNPQTLARDVKLLEEKGFSCKDIQGVDMFAHTYHVECVTVLEKAK